MSPRSAAAIATRPAPRTVAPSSRPTLRPVIEPTRSPRRSPVPTARTRRRLHPVTVAVGVVVVALLAVVVGNLTLAAGQLRLGTVQSELAQKEATFDALLEHNSALQSPANVANIAHNRHLVQPSQTILLPWVSLTARLGPPVFSAAPCCAVTPGR